MAGAAIALAGALFLSWVLYEVFKAIPYIFARYGGCTADLLRLCHPHTVAVRTRAGMLLFVIVGISSLVAGFSWSQIMKNPMVGVGVFVGWFVVFSFIDSILMATLDGMGEPLHIAGESAFQRIKRLSLAWGKTGIAYGVRIAIVVLTAHINTTVVQGFFFGAEIEAVISKQATDLVEPAIKKRDEANKVKGAVITKWETHLAQMRNALQDHKEARTDRVGEIAAEIKRQEAEYINIKENGVEVRALKAAEAELEAARIRAAEPVGQADRDKILQGLAEENPIIHYLYWMIFTIELAAFIVKVLRGKDEYDQLVTSYRAFSRHSQYQPPVARREGYQE